MAVSDRLLLAIDGGQTATKTLIATADGRVCGSGRGGPTVHYHSEGGVDKNRQSLHGAIRSAVANSKTEGSDIASICLGITGVPEGGDEIPIIQGIVGEILAPDSVVVRPDTLTNLLGASGGDAGVVVIAGGGAIGYGMTVDGDIAISNGFGYWLGDEGGAFWIGMRAIEAASRASDRRGDSTKLEAIVKNHFEIQHMRDLPRTVYRADFRRDRISQLAPEVFAVARADDPAALQIVNQAARELAMTAAGVLRQLHREGDHAVVYPTGGVFTERDLFLDPFTDELQGLWPAADVTLPRFPPAVGGLILAARESGIEVGESWLANIEATLDP